MAGRAPQKRTIFPVSSLIFHLLPPRSSRRREAPDRFFVHVVLENSLEYSCSLSIRLTYYWKAIVFSRWRFSLMGWPYFIAIS